jgi:hypothetical protein
MRHAPAFALWAAAFACWVWLFRGARQRARLVREIGRSEGGFVRTRFSWTTLTPEAAEVEFVRMAGDLPCLHRLRFLLPPVAARPSTVLEVRLEGRAVRLGAGTYGPEDLASGRGLFIGGTDFTAYYASFAGSLPPAARPRLAWEGSRVALAIPGLLGPAEAFWVGHCFSFLDGLVSRL